MKLFLSEAEQTSHLTGNRASHLHFTPPVWIWISVLLRARVLQPGLCCHVHHGGQNWFGSVRWSPVREEVLCFESVQVFHTQNKLIRLHFPSGLAVCELEDVWSSFSPVVHLQTHHVVPFSLLSARCVAEENGANHQQFSDVVETPADWSNQRTVRMCPCCWRTLSVRRVGGLTNRETWRL